MRRLAWIFIMTSFLTGPIASADDNAGRAVFNSNCSVCHSAQAGVNKIGPSLHGVIGRRAGSLPDYSYSAAMKNSGKVWDPETMVAFLQNPRGTVPGTKMSFPGLHQPEAVQKIIPYLAGLK